MQHATDSEEEKMKEKTAVTHFSRKKNKIFVSVENSKN